MLNYEELTELSLGLKHAAGEVDRLAEQNFDLAEAIVDFERGTLTMPELVAKAKEVLR